MKAEKKVLIAARLWWRNRRPLSWSPADHLANPTINTCTESEKVLALAVAAMVKATNKVRVA